ncbi:MAG: SGNH/GDSL hydrolase family protein [Acidobacteria bacterium]|nr:SGNH/GDSL hydrolase family protein [Acidobacteriota bacterium]
MGLFFLLCGSGRAFAQAAPVEPGGTAWASSVLEPFWTSTRMRDETVMFVQRPEEQEVSGRLLFTPTRIVRVTSAFGTVVYQAGRDYVWEPGSKVLTLPQNSRIPVTTWARLHPPKGGIMSLGEAADGKSSLLFEESGAYFETLQVAVTYDHEEPWRGVVPQSAGKNLARTLAKLRAKKLKLVVFADSVSAGAGASGFFNAPPNQPPYTELVAQGLRARFGAEVHLVNLAEGGQDTTWAVKMAHAAAEQNPDVVILGFGGNDATRKISAEDFRRNMQTAMDTIRKTAPDTDFILIATMTANPDWPESDADLCRQYRDALFQLAGPGVAVADEFSLWQELVQRKNFLDLTANGINHPNDFGHRVYAQVVLQLLQ